MIWLLFATCVIDSWEMKAYHQAYVWRSQESEEMCKINARDIRDIKPGSREAWCVRGEK
jgi:hypothetical protein